MKRRDLVKLLEKNGWKSTGGTKHEKWTKDSQMEMVPWGHEINEFLAKAIIKRRGLK